MYELGNRHLKVLLRTLEGSGQPTKWGASLINVGTEKVLREINQDFLKDHLLPMDGLDGGGACKWIEADYGNGKTQFLRCIQELAWQNNYVTAFVELSQDECPLDRIDLIFSSIAKAIQPPPGDLSDLERVKGLDNTILKIVDGMFPDSISSNGEQQDKLINWVDQLSSVPCESSSIAVAASCLIRSVIGGDSDKERIARSVLRGDVLPLSELREIGVHEKLDRSTGFRYLRSMCQFLQRSQMTCGVVLLFDEARRSLSLMANKAKKMACENLLNIINRCNSGDLPGTLFMYAVMPEFFTGFATMYPALQQRCSPRTRIPLNVLVGIGETELLVAIGVKITGLYSVAYEQSFEQDVLQGNLHRLAHSCIRSTMGSGSRRKMVQGTVAMLNRARNLGGLESLSDVEIDSILEGMEASHVESLEDEVRSEGE
jgi:hypothetical protein